MSSVEWLLEGNFPLLFIPNSLNNFQIVLGSDHPYSIFLGYVFFFAMFIRFVTLFRTSLYAVILTFILHLFRSFMQSSISRDNQSG